MEVKITIKLVVTGGEDLSYVGELEYIEGFNRLKIQAKYYRGSIQKDKCREGNVRVIVVISENGGLLE